MTTHQGEDDSGRSTDWRLAEVSDRLDRLTRGVERLAEANVASLQRLGSEQPSRKLADLVARLDRRLDQLCGEGSSAGIGLEQRVSAGDFVAVGQPAERATDDPDRQGPPGAGPREPSTALDQALDEIADRQRALDGYAPLPSSMLAPTPPGHADTLPRATTQELSELEHQLRRVNARTETLKQPSGLEQALDSLRDQLAEIALMIQEATPRKALEALEQDVRHLADRVDRSRGSGGDAATLGGIDRGLDEVRDGLRALAPAETLAAVAYALQELSQKIDRTTATPLDPSKLGRLENAVGALRDLVSQAASNEAFSKLSQQVGMLAGKIDEAAGADVFVALQDRIEALAGAVNARSGAGCEGSRQFESLLKELTDRIERVELARDRHRGPEDLDDRIGKLLQKLDASDACFDRIETVERGLAELMAQLDRRRPPDAAPTDLAATAEVDAPSREVAELEQAEKKAQGALGVVQDTVGHVVDRLGRIETGMHGTSAGQPLISTPAAAASPGPALPSLAAPALSCANIVQPGDWQSAARPATGTLLGAPIDPELPPDHPLEPGSGAAPGRIRGSAAERIAASKAAFGLAKQPLMTEPVGKPNFIAAARRAAQAALREAPVGKEQPVVTPAGKLAHPLDKLRALLAGASAVLLLLGILQFTRGFLGDASDGHVNAVSESSRAAPVGPESSRPDGATEGQAVSQTPPPGAPPQAPAAPETAPYASSDPGSGLPAVAAADSPEAAGASVEDRPAVAASPTPEAMPQPAELTGSVAQPAKGTVGSAKAAARPASGSATPATAQPAPASAAGPIPGEFSSALRAAAAKGDPSAQFEIALRYAEGRGVAQSFSEAARWFERAANQGLVPAQFRLAGLYEKGLGVTKNLDIARRYYAAAGEAGNAKALHNLAVLYAEGMGGDPDYQTAARWFRRAADYGLIDSQYNLAVLNARGIGVEQNLAEAYRWFALAAREGDPEASRKRDEAAAHLDARALRSAIQAVRAWRAEPQPRAANHVEAPPGGWHAKLPSEPASAPLRRKPPATPPKGELASPRAAQ